MSIFRLIQSNISSVQGIVRHFTNVQLNDSRLTLSHEGRLR